MRNLISATVLMLTLVASLSMGCLNPARAAAAVMTDDGILIHEVKSPYEEGVTQVRVLLPGKMQSRKRYRVIYVLPVEAQGENGIWRRATGSEKTQSKQSLQRHLRRPDVLADAMVRGPSYGSLNTSGELFFEGCDPADRENLSCPCRNRVDGCCSALANRGGAPGV